MINLNHSGFTLIELLIVVAIIGILAAIAIPNFLQAQVRAKVARAQSDLRTLSMASDLYQVDNEVYPLDGNDYAIFNPANFNVFERLTVLTTPVDYVSSLPEDPFHVTLVQFPSYELLFPQTAPPYTYVYNTYGNNSGFFGPGPDNQGKPDNFTFSSLGPSLSFDSNALEGQIFYDPTNGTVSRGDIHRAGGRRVEL